VPNHYSYVPHWQATVIAHSCVNAVRAFRRSNGEGLAELLSAYAENPGATPLNDHKRVSRYLSGETSHKRTSGTE